MSQSREKSWEEVPKVANGIAVVRPDGDLGAMPLRDGCMVMTQPCLWKSGSFGSTKRGAELPSEG